MSQVIWTIQALCCLGFWMALYYWWVILLFILAGIALNMALSGVTDPITREAAKATKELQELRADLRNAELQRQWDRDRRQQDNWVEYAQRNPNVRLDMVEKVTTDGDRFTAEKHAKLSGPVAPPDRFTGLPSDRLPSYTVGWPLKEKKVKAPKAPKVTGPVDRTGLPF